MAISNKPVSHHSIIIGYFLLRSACHDVLFLQGAFLLGAGRPEKLVMTSQYIKGVTSIIVVLTERPIDKAEYFSNKDESVQIFIDKEGKKYTVCN